jgi:hypothetical protein
LPNTTAALSAETNTTTMRSSMYTRLNQSFHTNPKLRAVGYAAKGAYADLLSYCAGDHSDGEIPEPIAEAIATTEHLATLNEHELLHKRDGYWVITGYLTADNQTCAEYKAGREKEAKKKRRQRAEKKAAKSNGHFPEKAADIEVPKF